MMKTIYKNTFSVFVIVALVMPMTVMAEDVDSAMTRAEEMKVKQAERRAEMDAKRTEKMAENESKRLEAFCSRFTEQAAKIAANITEHKGQLQERKENRDDTISQNRDNRDAILENKRSDTDGRRSEMYAKLEAKADTDAKKAAVADFKDTVEKAVDTRRVAVNTALETFRKGVDAAVVGRKDDMKKNADAFEAAVNNALEKAKADCDGGSDQETIRSNFRSALTAARASLKEDRSASDKVSTEMKALAETRRTAVKKAVESFQATMQSAKDTLKQVFGEKSDS